MSSDNNCSSISSMTVHSRIHLVHVVSLSFVSSPILNITDFSKLFCFQTIRPKYEVVISKLLLQLVL